MNDDKDRADAETASRLWGVSMLPAKPVVWLSNVDDGYKPYQPKPWWRDPDFWLLMLVFQLAGLAWFFFTADFGPHK